MNPKRKIIVGITGASGSIYARLTIKALLEDQSIDELAVILTDTAREVMEYENQSIQLNDTRITFYDIDDMFAPPASGSSDYEAMIIVPCSTGTMGRISGGTCNDLLARSADVILKQRRKLIIALRESPLSLIHINNMKTLTECGAIIMPLSPGFYSQPKDLKQLCEDFSRKLAVMTGAKIESYNWGEKCDQ